MIIINLKALNTMFEFIVKIFIKKWKLTEFKSK